MELPPIHVINLDRGTARLKTFAEWNRHLPGWTRFSAVNGADLDLDQLQRDGILDGELSFGRGMLGCALSHVSLWRRVAAEGRAITVFEDDAIAAHCFPQAATEIIQALPPDWDFVLWGYLLHPLFVWIDVGTVCTKIEGYGAHRIRAKEDLAEFQRDPIVAGAPRLRHAFGLQAYSISPSGARAALDYYLPLRRRLITFSDTGVAMQDGGPDVALCGLYPSLKAYISLPQLVVSFDQGTSERDRVDEASVEPQGMKMPAACIISRTDRTDRWNDIRSLFESAGMHVERWTTDALAAVGSLERTHVQIVRHARAAGHAWIVIIDDDVQVNLEDIHRFCDLLPFLWERRQEWGVFNGGPIFSPGDVQNDPHLKLFSAEHRLVYAASYGLGWILYHAGAYEEVATWEGAGGLRLQKFLFDLHKRDTKPLRTLVTAPHIAVSASPQSEGDDGRWRFTQDRIEDCLGEEEWLEDQSQHIRIAATHLYWKSAFRLHRNSDRLYLEIYGSRGFYHWDGIELHVRWHWHPEEVFINLNDNCILKSAIDLLCPFSSKALALDGGGGGVENSTVKCTDKKEKEAGTSFVVRFINLDRCTDRMVTFCRNNETIQYERYQAIDGLTLDRDALIRDGVITPDNEFGAGALGAAMSHIGLWYRCLEENKVYHIAEDDAIIHPHAPKKIADLLSPIDDWDIVFWGWNFDFPMIVGYSSVVRPVTLMFDQEVLRQKSKLFPATCLIESTLVRLEHCTGLPFYSISPRGARMFLAHCLPIGANKLPPRGQRNFEVANKGLDIELGHHLPGAMAFACLPPLAITLNEHHTSTIWTDPPNS